MWCCKVGTKSPKSERWNGVVKVAVERKDAARKDVLGAKYETEIKI